MCATDANVIGTAVGDLPTCRQLHNVIIVVNLVGRMNVVKMQRRVQVGAVALSGMVGRGIV